jgi:hypothetical protein
MIKKLKKRIKKKIVQIYENRIGYYYFRQKGFCLCCDSEVEFIAHKPWLRDHFICNKCGCKPRERALMKVIEQEYPNWRELKIHESSPINRGHSLKIKKGNKNNYLASQYYPNEPLGKVINGFRNEDLENQTFKDDSFDIVVTSDVMEHIYDPEKAFKEIYRTLKPGGAHIFSVPIINKFKKTQRWAKKGENGEPIFLYKPEWHGNPVDKKGSPVTMHWGFDIVDFIKEKTGAESWIEYFYDLEHGISGEYIEIVVQKKQ